VNEHVSQILDLVRQTTIQAGRKPEEVKVMVAAKYGETDIIEDIIASGIHVVGENHVQKAERWQNRARDFQLHLIGHLQTNKIKSALDVFDFIDTIDSAHLAEEIDRKAIKIYPCMIEVNISGEEQKSGVGLDDFDGLAGFIIDSCKHLRLSGVFTMAPVDADTQIAENIFLKADTMAARLEQRTGTKMERCYGMSDDYKAAIGCGSTLLRLGRILFGGGYGNR
jgi:PLP dependent protein